MQKPQLRHIQKQEKQYGTSATKKILQILQDPHQPQGNQVKEGFNGDLNQNCEVQ